MHSYRLFLRRANMVAVFALAVGAALPTWAGDIDGDGVEDENDVCSNTPVGTAVDAEGRPLGDIDLDCDTDLDDFAQLAAGLTGPLEPVGACCHYPERACLMQTEAECTGDWHGAGSSCASAPCAVLPELVLVPAGEFAMGDGFSEGESDELPVHDVFLSAYYIDIYEVTNQQYADTLNWAWALGNLIEIDGAGAVKRAGGSEVYCDTTTSSEYSQITWDGAAFGVVDGKADHPMVQVSWFGAAAFCNWRSAREGRTQCYDLATWTCDFEANGYRLPTEAEWEKAAGWDPDEQRHYRFAEHTDGCGYDCLNGQRANYYLSGDPFELETIPRSSPVGYYDGSDHGGAFQTQDARCYYGCRDMSGNVFEWCNDWYDSSYYGASPFNNPTGPPSGSFRVTRGGGWNAIPYLARSANRDTDSPTALEWGNGFRCVTRTP
jgi:sulfatase modifying factor 1